MERFKMLVCWAKVYLWVQRRLFLGYFALPVKMHCLWIESCQLPNHGRWGLCWPPHARLHGFIEALRSVWNWKLQFLLSPFLFIMWIIFIPAFSIGIASIRMPNYCGSMHNVWVYTGFTSLKPAINFMVSSFRFKIIMTVQMYKKGQQE